MGYGGLKIFKTGLAMAVAMAVLLPMPLEARGCCTTAAVTVTNFSANYGPITNAVQGVVQAVNRANGSITTALEAHKNAMIAAMQSVETASLNAHVQRSAQESADRARMRAWELYGPQSVTRSGCNSGGRARSVSRGDLYRASSQASVVETLAERRTTVRSASEAARQIADLPAEALQARHLLGSTATAPPARKEAERLAAQVTAALDEPFVLPPVDPAQAGTPAGKAYTAHRHAMEAALSLGAQAQAEVAGLMALPLYEVNARVAEMMQQARMPADRHVSPDRTTTLDRLFAAEAGSRFSNEDWYARINSANEVALAREAVQMQAAALRMQHQQLRLSAQTLAVLATMMARQVGQMEAGGAFGTPGVAASSGTASGASGGGS